MRYIRTFPRICSVWYTGPVFSKAAGAKGRSCERREPTELYRDDLDLGHYLQDGPLESQYYYQCAESKPDKVTLTTRRGVSRADPPDSGVGDYARTMRSAGDGSSLLEALT